MKSIVFLLFLTILQISVGNIIDPFANDTPTEKGKFLRKITVIKSQIQDAP